MADAGRKIIAVCQSCSGRARIKRCVNDRPRVSLLSSVVLEPTFFVVSQALVSCRFTTSKLFCFCHHLPILMMSCRIQELMFVFPSHCSSIYSNFRAGLDRTLLEVTLRRCLLGSGHCLYRQHFSSSSFAMQACFRLFNRFRLLPISLLVDLGPRRSRSDQRDSSDRH